MCVEDFFIVFMKSLKRLKRDGKKGGKCEDGKSRFCNVSKYKR